MAMIVAPRCMFSETSVLTGAIWCNIPEDIRHCYCRENTPEDTVLRPYIVSLYGSLSSPSVVRYIVSLRAGKIQSPITLQMEAKCSPKRRNLLEPRVVISEETFLIVKAWNISSRWTSGIVGSNPTRGMDKCLRCYHGLCCPVGRQRLCGSQSACSRVSNTSNLQLIHFLVPTETQTAKDFPPILPDYHHLPPSIPPNVFMVYCLIN
jgi:hypothetical protein